MNIDAFSRFQRTLGKLVCSSVKYARYFLCRLKTVYKDMWNMHKMAPFCIKIKSVCGIKNIRHSRSKPPILIENPPEVAVEFERNHSRIQHEIDHPLSKVVRDLRTFP